MLIKVKNKYYDVRMIYAFNNKEAFYILHSEHAYNNIGYERETITNKKLFSYINSSIYNINLNDVITRRLNVNLSCKNSFIIKKNSGYYALYINIDNNFKINKKIIVEEEGKDIKKYYNCYYIQSIKDFNITIDDYEAKFLKDFDASINKYKIKNINDVIDNIRNSKINIQNKNLITFYNKKIKEGYQYIYTYKEQLNLNNFIIKLYDHEEKSEDLKAFESFKDDFEKYFRCGYLYTKYFKDFCEFYKIDYKKKFMAGLSDE